MTKLATIDRLLAAMGMATISSTLLDNLVVVLVTAAMTLIGWLLRVSYGNIVTSLNNQTAEIRTLNGAVNRMTIEFNDINDDVMSLKERIGEAEKTVSAIRADVDVLRQRGHKK